MTASNAKFDEISSLVNKTNYGEMYKRAILYDANYCYKLDKAITERSNHPLSPTGKRLRRYEDR